MVYSEVVLKRFPKSELRGVGGEQIRMRAR